MARSAMIVAVLSTTACGSGEDTGSDSAGLKRLTAVQYENTVDDLLPGLEQLDSIVEPNRSASDDPDLHSEEQV